MVPEYFSLDFKGVVAAVKSKEYITDEMAILKVTPVSGGLRVEHVTFSRCCPPEYDTTTVTEEEINNEI
jgi:2-hydroxy-3-keto-5-methylthiopentenyl-1-phosphate phosphatase